MPARLGGSRRSTELTRQIYTFAATTLGSRTRSLRSAGSRAKPEISVASEDSIGVPSSKYRG
jgi:hypothetical protein